MRNSSPHTAKTSADHDQFRLTQADNLHVEEEVPINGQTRIFASTKSRLKDSRGTTMGLVGISRDITELKKAQQTLRLTDLVFQTSPDQMFILGRDFRFCRVNAHIRTPPRVIRPRPTGTDPDGRYPRQGHTSSADSSLLNRCFQGETIHQGSWVQFPGSREPVYGRESYFPLQNLDGSIDEVVVIGRDWTDWKLSEDALAANEHRLRTILDGMTNFVGIGTPEGIVVDCNQAPLQLAGLQREDVIGKHLTDTYWVNYSPLVQQQVRDILQRVAHGETVREGYLARMGKPPMLWSMPAMFPCVTPLATSYNRAFRH
ncbi:MAG: PAS domain-containing protein [Nitrospirales bacterium]|nr:PAS domain-containing protein [Nitrospirales bacterium]